MSDQTMPSYESCQSAFDYFEALGTPADAHGLLCALLCAGAKMHSKAWVDALLTKPLNTSKDRSQFDVLKAFYDVTLEQSETETPGIELLLPDEDASLDMRLEALSSWAQGFITGLGLVGVNIEPGSHSEPEIKEAIEDLTQISLLASDGIDAGDDEDGAEQLESFEVLKTHAQLCMNMLKASSSKLGVRLAEHKTDTTH